MNKALKQFKKRLSKEDSEWKDEVIPLVAIIIFLIGLFLGTFL